MRAWIEIDLGAIRANVRLLQEQIGAERQVMAVVKADGYGHGLVPVAHAVTDAGCSWIGVATVEEGIAIRLSGVRAPLCLLCPFIPSQASELLEYGLTPIVGDYVSLRALVAAHKKLQTPRFPQSMVPNRFGNAIHLDIDTGMGRSGILGGEVVDFWREAVASGLAVTGISTHFADADNPDPTFTLQQEALFLDALRTLQRQGGRFDWVHTSNSPATLRNFCAFANLVRPGLLLYGVSPYDDAGEVSSEVLPRLVPALTLKTRVGTVRELPEGHSISYGVTKKLTRPSRVATILIGYGDGYSRRLSGVGQMLIRGRRAPILGRVCMDQTVVDVTDMPEVVAGDEVVCIGAQGDERIDVESIAHLIDSTPHEVTTGLTSRLLRCYP